MKYEESMSSTVVKSISQEAFDMGKFDGRMIRGSVSRGLYVVVGPYCGLPRKLFDLKNGAQGGFSICAYETVPSDTIVILTQE